MESRFTPTWRPSHPSYLRRLFLQTHFFNRAHTMATLLLCSHSLDQGRGGWVGQCAINSPKMVVFATRQLLPNLSTPPKRKLAGARELSLKHMGHPKSTFGNGTYPAVLPFG